MYLNSLSSFIHNIYHSFARKFICAMCDFSPAPRFSPAQKILWKVFEYLSSRRLNDSLSLCSHLIQALCAWRKWQNKQKNLEILLAAPTIQSHYTVKHGLDVVMCVILAWRIEPPYPQRQTCHSQAMLKYGTERMRECERVREWERWWAINRNKCEYCTKKTLPLSLHPESNNWICRALLYCVCQQILLKMVYHFSSIWWH